MVSAKDNEALTRVGPGTPMGDLFREYWIPACLSSELVADGEPMRLLLLGERLVAFRDSAGRIGILEHSCPHRCASLFFGRNEEGGLRCVYHGWKFDVEGRCLDMPNVPPSQDFKHRIRQKAYRTVERAGLVWAYMGTRAEPPALPDIDALMLPEGQRRMRLHLRDCNWLQSLEGDIDTSHFGFLHVGHVSADEVDPSSMHRLSIADRAPLYKATETDWGAMYVAYRDADPGELYYRFSHFLMPFYTMTPNGDFRDLVSCTINVPMDDEHTMTYIVDWTGKSPALQKLRSGEAIAGMAQSMDYLPRTSDWLGRWRLADGYHNDYGLDREAQRHKTYSGIQGVSRQDQAIVGSMGEIVDRSREHLAPSDRMIMLTRRHLLDAARRHAKEKRVPPTVDRPELYRGARGGSFLAPASLDWLDAYARKLPEAQTPPGLLRAEIAAE